MNGTTGASKHGDMLDGAPSIAPLPPPKSISSNTSTVDFTTRALKFLSTASAETIGGIAAGLAACTYLILGRLGLVLIGILGGVVLHATWEGQSSAAASSLYARRENGLDIVKRILDLRDGRRAEVGEGEKDAIANSFEGFQPETAAALNNLVDAIIRDYVKWWYSPILPKDSSFPAASRQTLTRFLLSISQNLSRKRPADTFLDFLTNSSSIIIVFLNELSGAMNLSQGTNVPAAEAIYTYLSANPESNLANILSERQQARKFKMIAEDILQNFLEKPTYDCDPARIFLREMLGGLCLEMTLKTCSKPEWINEWIVYLLEEGEPDLSQAIDAGMGTGIDLLSSADIDGNVGNISLAKPARSQAERQQQESRKHKKRLSKAEEAMEEAMEEAKRLSQLIAEEDAKKVQSPGGPLEAAPEPLPAAVSNNAKALGLNAAPIINPDLTKVQPPPEEIASNTSSTLRRATSDPFSELPLSHESPKETMPQESESKPVNSEKIEQLVASPTPTQNAAFTSFDQLVPQSVPLPLQDGLPTPPLVRRKTVSLTLHNANIIIDDDSTKADTGRLRSKPNTDYLIQIEPASPDHPGWMIVRRYPDFETLHEVLRRIAQVSGVKAFTEQHSTLPNWKAHTKPSLRGELERYLRDACWYQPLAESEGMKRFLEKDGGQLMSGSGSKNGFPGIGWPSPSAFETMGKGMLDVLTSAPKGVAEGGKFIGGGITGALTNIGNLGQKKPGNGSANGGANNLGMQHGSRASTSILPRMDSMNSIVSARASRASEDSLHALPIVSTQPSKMPGMERRPSWNSIAESESEREPRKTDSARSSMSGRRSTTQSRDPSRAPSRRGTPLSSPTQIMGELNFANLPPPPSDMPDDYGRQLDESSTADSRTESNVALTTRTSTSTTPSQQSPGRPPLSAPRRQSVPVITTSRKPRTESTPLSEGETRQAVELMFAVINEMYTLSSAWKFRRTLLTAAKTFLLRPNNPSLLSIQSLIQDSIIASNTSDLGIATHLRKLRENTLPTEEELKAWPPEPTIEEKERLRIKARKLLVERGVPAALTGVMGQAATGEAMGRIFDCLQVEEVARGLMFGLLLQGVRAVTQ